MNRIRPLLAAVALALLVAACGTGAPPTPTLSVISDALTEGMAGEVYEFFFAADDLPDDVSLVTFEWEFGDGTTGRRVVQASGGAAVHTATHTYEDGGDYELIVTVLTSAGRELASSTITVTIGTDHRFLRPVSFPAGQQAHSIAIDDLDEDGQPDLVVTASDDGAVAILWGQAGRSFLEPEHLSMAGRPKHAVIADFNEDGCLDLAVGIEEGGPGNEVALFLSEGGECGTFEPVEYLVGCGQYTHQVAVGRFNDDDYLDLVAVCSDGPMIAVLPGNGDGTFGAVVPIDSGGTDLHAVTVADFDQDENVDLAVAALGTSRMIVLLSNGDMTFDGPVAYEAFSSPHGIKALDLNDDGFPDLVTANRSSNVVSVFLNQGDGAFDDQVRYGVGLPPTVADECSDTSESPTQSGECAHSTEVAIGDINGDGHPDIVVTNTFGNYSGGTLPTNIGVLYGQAGGTFSDAVTVPLQLTPFSVQIADLDGDGHLDVAVANWDSDDVKILYNSGISAGDEAAVAPR